MTPLLQIDEARAQDNAAQVTLRAISIELDRAEIGLIIGGPHSGKSLLLRTIAGETLPISGHVRLGNRDISLEPVWHRRKRGIALASQSPPRFDLMTAEEQMCLGLGRRRLPTKLKRRLIGHLPEVGPLLTTPMYKLSRQAHRLVDVASCVLQKPAVMLLDEPAVDFGAERAIELIGGLRKMDITVLVADRYAAPLLTIADRAWLMADGRIVKSGKPSDFANDSTLLAASLGDTFSTLED